MRIFLLWRDRNADLFPIHRLGSVRQEVDPSGFCEYLFTYAVAEFLLPLSNAGPCDVALWDLKEMYRRFDLEIIYIIMCPCLTSDVNRGEKGRSY